MEALIGALRRCSRQTSVTTECSKASGVQLVPAAASMCRTDRAQPQLLVVIAEAHWELRVNGHHLNKW